jgi:pimeloyl-ACP methyl ester carboxylesterase
VQRTNVKGSNLEYDVLGSGEPVLLVHGVLVAELLRPLAEEESLAGSYKLILYHRRGVAGSDRVTPPFTIKDQAADARGLLEELGIECAHVVGHSYGAAIALQLAADAPQMVHTLTVLEAPSVAVASTAQVVQAAEPIGQRFASGDKEGAANDFVAAMGGVGVREVLDERLPGSYEQAVADADALFTAEFPALGEWAFSAEEAKRIEAPVLRVHGEDTIPWFAESDALLSEWLPDSESSTVAGQGHFFPLLDPQRVAENVVPFLARHPMN